jgi:hypothetical protein
MRRLFVTLGVALLCVGGAITGYKVVLDRSYSDAACYPDAGISPDANDSRASVITRRPGRITLLLTRGERESPFMTDASWHEEVAIEIPRPSAGDRIDLAGPDERVGYGKSQPFFGQTEIGDRGVRGQIEIHAIDGGGLAASYEVVLDGYSARLLPDHRHREVAFRGRSRFPAHTPPPDRRYWSLWPRANG